MKKFILKNSEMNWKKLNRVAGLNKFFSIVWLSAADRAATQAIKQ